MAYNEQMKRGEGEEYVPRCHRKGILIRRGEERGRSMYPDAIERVFGSIGIPSITIGDSNASAEEGHEECSDSNQLLR